MYIMSPGFVRVFTFKHRLSLRGTALQLEAEMTGWWAGQENFLNCRTSVAFPHLTRWIGREASVSLHSGIARKGTQWEQDAAF